jgi:hypothetical protein
VLSGAQNLGAFDEKWVTNLRIYAEQHSLELRAAAAPSDGTVLPTGESLPGSRQSPAVSTPSSTFAPAIPAFGRASGIRPPLVTAIASNVSSSPSPALSSEGSTQLRRSRLAIETSALEVDDPDVQEPATKSARKAKRQIDLVDDHEGAEAAKSIKRTATDSAPESSKSKGVIGKIKRAPTKSRTVSSTDNDSVEPPSTEPKKRTKAASQRTASQTAQPAASETKELSDVDPPTVTPPEPLKRTRSSTTTGRGRKQQAGARASPSTDAEPPTPGPSKRAGSRTPKAKDVTNKIKKTKAPAKADLEERGPGVPNSLARKLIAIGSEWKIKPMEKLAQQAIDGSWGSG